MEASTSINLKSPTVLGMLRSMGVDYNVAVGCQVVAATISAAAVWMAWRQFDVRNPRPAILALCAATFLATPHALWYDLTMLSGALILYGTSRPAASLRSWERSLILLGIVLPSVSAFSANADPLILAAILWMACTAQARWAPSSADATQDLSRTAAAFDYSAYGA
jgi:hypothetical protein